MWIAAANPRAAGACSPAAAKYTDAQITVASRDPVDAVTHAITLSGFQRYRAAAAEPVCITNLLVELAHHPNSNSQQTSSRLAEDQLDHAAATTSLTLEQVAQPVCACAP